MFKQLFNTNFINDWMKLDHGCRRKDRIDYEQSVTYCSNMFKDILVFSSILFSFYTKRKQNKKSLIFSTKNSINSFQFQLVISVL